MKIVLAAALLALPLAGCIGTFDAASTTSVTRYSSVLETPAIAAAPVAEEVEATGSVGAAPRAPRCEYDPYNERRVCYR